MQVAGKAAGGVQHDIARARRPAHRANHFALADRRAVPQVENPVGDFASSGTALSTSIVDLADKWDSEQSFIGKYRLILLPRPGMVMVW